MAVGDMLRAEKHFSTVFAGSALLAYPVLGCGKSSLKAHSNLLPLRGVGARAHFAGFVCGH